MIYNIFDIYPYVTAHCKGLTAAKGASAAPWRAVADKPAGSLVAFCLAIPEMNALYFFNCGFEVISTVQVEFIRPVRLKKYVKRLFLTNLACHKANWLICHFSLSPLMWPKHHSHLLYQSLFIILYFSYLEKRFIYTTLQAAKISQKIFPPRKDPSTWRHHNNLS